MNQYYVPRPTETIKIRRTARNAVTIFCSDKGLNYPNREVRLNFQDDYVQVQILINGETSSLTNIQDKKAKKRFPK